jgi:hypothetical protein
MLKGLSFSWSGFSAGGLGSSGKFGADHYKSVSRSFKIEGKPYPETSWAATIAQYLYFQGH